jgi:predicted Zn-dependent protease
MAARPALRVAGGVLLFCAMVLAVGAEPPDLAKAVRDLGDNSFEVREKASAILRAAGRAAEPILAEATQSNDAEVVRRSKEILEDFQWGIYPDTPKQLLPLIESYRSGDLEAKLDSLQKLIEAGRPGYAVLGKVVPHETDKDVKLAVRAAIDKEVTVSAGRLIARGDDAAADELLALGLVTGQEASYRNFAALALVRRQLPARITEFTKRAAKEGESAARVLVYLHRANEDLASARRVAEKLDDAPLLQGLLVESADWRGLARLLEKQGAKLYPELIERMGFTLAAYRLSGDAPSADRVARDLKKINEDAGDADNIHQAVKALFLNDRTAEGFALLRLDDADPRRLFELLVGQGKYEEAFALAKKAEGATRVEMALRQIQVEYLLGEPEKARKTLDAVREEVAEGLKRGNIFEEEVVRLVKFEVRIGRKDQAAADLFRLLPEEPGNKTAVPRFLAALFPDHSEAVLPWLELFGDSTAREKYGKVKEIFGGKMAGKDLDAAFERADTPNPTQSVALLEAMADAALANGREAAAVKYLERAAEGPSSSPRLRLGDLFAEKKKWAEAAEQYRLAGEKQPGEPLPMLLRGRALVQAGQKEEGAKYIERAHALPLADESVRYAFSSALEKRSLAEEARREYVLIGQVGALDSYPGSEALRRLAFAAMHRQDHARANELFERFRLQCLRSATEFVDAGALLQVPTLVQHNRARALLAAGKLDEARKIMATCQELMPDNVDLPIEYVAALEKADAKAVADEVFARALAVQEKLCSEHPRSANAHNTLAWLAACSRRDLDKAAEHAKKAVELAPNKAGYLDTLAEVHFQRGEQEQAVATMKRCVELEPKRDYYRKQAKRFAAGDKMAPVPTPDDDDDE